MAHATFGDWRRELQTTEADLSEQFGSEPLARTASQTLQQGPSILAWVRERMATRERCGIVMGFLVSEMTFQVASVSIANPDRNIFGLAMVSWPFSLAVALTLTFVHLGRGAIPRVLSVPSLKRFSVIMLLSFAGTGLFTSCFQTGAQVGAIWTIAQVYLPVAAVLSVPIMGRSYGILEWLSLGVISLTITTLIHLKMEALDWGALSSLTPWHVFVIVLAMVMQAVAGILSERIYKGRSQGIEASGTSREKVFVYKVHQDLLTLVNLCVFWLLGNGPFREVPFFKFSQEIFMDASSWGIVHLLLAVAMVVRFWMLAYVQKYLSTVTVGILTSLVVVINVLLLRPVFWHDFRFQGGFMPLELLAVILFVACIIFQTGRINLTIVMSLLETQRHPRPRLPPLASSVQAVRSVIGHLSFGALPHNGQLATYSTVALFVIADAGRTLVAQQALSKVMITPVSMPLSTYLGGILMASILTVNDGLQSTSSLAPLEGLKLSFNPGRILAFLPCACFFALASTLTSMAYAVGISPALATVLGYVYMPASAVASSIVFGKTYLWLEWLGLIMLTASSALFGFLQNFFSSGGVDGEGSSIISMGLVVTSAIASVFGSLVAEKVLKAEQLPFAIQKCRLDVGSTFGTLLLLPIIGLVSSRSQDAFWKMRPLSKQCSDPLCWSSGGCAANCSCECGSGLFVAWDSWLVWLALTVNVTQSWLVGKIIKKFSTVMRAIVQSSSILVIYFIGDPLLNPNYTSNLSLTFVAFLVPLSTATFMVAVSEMEKVMEASEQRSVQ